MEINQMKAGSPAINGKMKIDLKKLIHRPEEPTGEELNECTKQFNLVRIRKYEPHKEDYKTIEEYKTFKLNWLTFYAHREEYSRKRNFAKSESYHKALINLEEYYWDVTEVLFSLRPTAWPVFFRRLQNGYESLRKMEKIIGVRHSTASTRIKELKAKGLLDLDGLAVKPGQVLGRQP